MCFFFFIHSLACIMPGRWFSAGLLPRQHQDPHDCVVWVLVSYGSREQELFSIIHCCTKLFVCFFDLHTRENEGDDGIQSKRNHQIHDLQHIDAGIRLNGQSAVKMACSQPVMAVPRPPPSFTPREVQEYIVPSTRLCFVSQVYSEQAAITAFISPCQGP